MRARRMQDNEIGVCCAGGAGANLTMWGRMKDSRTDTRPAKSRR